MTEALMSVPLKQILEQQYARRSSVSPEEIQELAASIAVHGLLTPILVCSEGDSYRLIAGRRRTLACRHLGWETIPAMVKTLDDDAAATVALTENLARADMRPLDEAVSLHRLIEVRGLSISAVAEAVGRSAGWVRGRLELLSYPEDLQCAVNEGAISMAVAELIIQVDDPEAREGMAVWAIESGATAAQVRRWVSDWRISGLTRSQEELADIAAAPVLEAAPIHHKCLMCDGVHPWNNTVAAFICNPCVENLQEAKREFTRESQREQAHE